MARSDFAWVNFDEQFNSSNTEASRSFTVEGNPFGTGYLLIQGFDLEQSNHRILINNKDLPSFDLPEGDNNQWMLWMDRIPSGFLKSGSNRLTIRRANNDDFFIANIAVNWREAG